MSLRPRVAVLGHVLLVVGLLGSPVAAQDKDLVPPPAQLDPHDHGPEPEAAPEEGYGFPGFNESQGCGQPATSNPLATKIGFLGNAELIRGYKGGFFGRSIGDVVSELVPWTVPLSQNDAGQSLVVMVHERALPAFQRAATNLNAAAANNPGQPYKIRHNVTAVFSPRTVAGSYSISNHALASTIDINWDTNPFRSDGVLVTDMPAWFVNAWKNAGFCWGGDWVESKDAMHFAWMGPTATPGYGDVPLPYPPKTGAVNFPKVNATYDLPFGALAATKRHLIADGSGNGLADVFQISDQPYGVLLEWSRTHRRHDWCAVDRAVAPGVSMGGRLPLFGDYEQNGRLDLWLIGNNGGQVDVEVILRSSAFTESVAIHTTIAAFANDGYLLGDYDRDGIVDLFVVRRAATQTTVHVWSGADDFSTKLLTVTTPLGDTRGSHLALGDRDLDDLPDLYVLEGTTLSILWDGYDKVTGTMTIPGGNWKDIAVNDYDGDGRDDLFLVTPGGRLDVRIGNTLLAGQTLTSWFVPADWDCPAGAPPFDYNGLFRDDDDSVHEADIDFIGALGITKGCNPPINDEFCPKRTITRGEMAAFLVRALDLTETGGIDFIDDDGSIFETDIQLLAAAGITRGCDPPANTKFCPNDPVTRGQMAAFLARAYELTVGAGDDPFVDDDGNIFEGDIGKIAAVGITKGCNPPVNDHYCPDSAVTREQMASFLARAIQS